MLLIIRREPFVWAFYSFIEFQTVARLCPFCAPFFHHAPFHKKWIIKESRLHAGSYFFDCIDDNFFLRFGDVCVYFHGSFHGGVPDALHNGLYRNTGRQQQADVRMPEDVGRQMVGAADFSQVAVNLAEAERSAAGCGKNISVVFIAFPPAIQADIVGDEIFDNRNGAAV